MRFNFSEKCATDCVQFDDCKKKVEGAEDIEHLAHKENLLFDEGEFSCDGPRHSSNRVEENICMGRITRLPNIKDEGLTYSVEAILGPIALDALSDADEKNRNSD